MFKGISQKAITWILAIYLGLGPIYWMPYTPSRAIALFKFALVASAVALTIYATASKRGNVLLPNGMFGIQGFWLLNLASLPGLIQAPTEEAIPRIIATLLIYVFVWAVYNHCWTHGFKLKDLWPSVVVIALASTLSVISGVTGWPSWYSNILDEPRTIGQVGFGGASTGWANGIALYLPVGLAILYAYFRNGPKWSYWWRILFVGGMIAGSQLSVGGRTGLLAAMVVFIYFFFKAFNRRIGMAALLIIAFLSVIYYDDYKEHLRFHRLQSGDIEDISRFSSDRVEGYIIGFELFLQKPFTGYGFGNTDLRRYGMKYPQIHNLWLKMAVDSGMFYTLIFMGLLVSLATRVWHFLRWNAHQGRDSTYIMILFSIFPAGLIVSSLGPSGIYGTFQNCAIFWAVVGYLLARIDMAKAEHKRATIAAKAQAMKETMERRQKEAAEQHIAAATAVTAATDVAIP